MVLGGGSLGRSGPNSFSDLSRKHRNLSKSGVEENRTWEITDIKHRTTLLKFLDQLNLAFRTVASATPSSRHARKKLSIFSMRRVGSVRTTGTNPSFTSLSMAQRISPDSAPSINPWRCRCGAARLATIREPAAADKENTCACNSSRLAVSRCCDMNRWFYCGKQETTDQTVTRTRAKNRKYGKKCIENLGRSFGRLSIPGRECLSQHSLQ